MGHKKEAQYDLDVAQVLVEHAKYSISKRARINLLNHGYLPKETIEDVFAAIRCSHFYKSVELENRPKHMQTFIDMFLVTEPNGT